MDQILAIEKPYLLALALGPWPIVEQKQWTSTKRVVKGLTLRTCNQLESGVVGRWLRHHQPFQHILYGSKSSINLGCGCHCMNPPFGG